MNYGVWVEMIGYKNIWYRRTVSWYTDVLLFVFVWLHFANERFSESVYNGKMLRKRFFFAQNDKYNSELIVKSIIIVFMNIDHQENFFHSPEIWRNCQATHVYRVFKYIFSPFDTQCFWVCMMYVQLFSHVLINGIEKLFSLCTSFVWNCAIRRRRRRGSWFSRG